MPILPRRTLLAAALATPVLAQTSAFPTRAVVIVDGYPPGGGSDIAARHLARELEARWSRPVVVENRSGGLGGIAAAGVARSEPDGHMLLMAHVAMVVLAPLIYPDMRPAAIRNFTPVSLVAVQPHVFVVAAASPLRDMAELLDLARRRAAEGRPLTYGAGMGSIQHLGVAMLAAEFGIEMQNIPYRGSAPALADLMAGNIDFIFEGITPASPFLQSDRIRALAVSGQRRVPGLDAPTLHELGLPSGNLTTWWAIVAPPGLPPARREVIAEAVQAGLESPRFVSFADGLGVMRGTGFTGARLEMFVTEETRQFAELFHRLQIKAE